MKVALYARTSTSDQHPDAQILELREHCQRHGWTVVREFIDDGVTGTAASRPALDAMLKDAKRRRFQAVVVWKLDRIGRSVRNLVLLLDDLQHAGVTFSSITEGIDLSSPGGRFMMHLLSALSEYERQVIAERVKLGLQRARKMGKRLGRPSSAVTDAEIASVAHLSLRDAAARLKVSKSAVSKWRRIGRAA
ncbi:MAG: hypothetical protein A3J29_23210 [Acidobacteria bacterium RIFCSPLOWO2_12_FULL_67_14b]|nr:MAG: hypothetical protein A3I61_13390 [Acidobacteria bacterium RIFCSPLOWO2_02_FULL_68_18]OFW45418.1 MAG: hypothetical protein A3J29_23210 [Acidobacteria bacterium RIFCSPLOWO2_12_FULL_67_14b]